MTRKVITLEFIIPTVLSIAIAIVLSIAAVYLTNIYLGPIDQAKANYSAVGKHWFERFAKPSHAAFVRFRLLARRCGTLARSRLRTLSLLFGQRAATEK
jgi:hypothetical protein